MTINNSLSTKKEPSRVALIFNICIAVFVVFIGILWALTNVIGGILVIIGGVIYSYKVKNLINANFPFLTSKIINIASIVVIVGGFSYGLEADRSNRAEEEWAKNSTLVIKEINKKIDLGELISAQFDIEKYEPFAKNNSDFKAAKSKYLAAEAIDSERRMEKLRQEKAAENAAKNPPSSSSSSSSGGNGGRVVSKINDVIYFATGEAVITRQTVLEINNQRIQNPDGSYIRVGDNCTFTTGYMGTATMFCSR